MEASCWSSSSGWCSWQACGGSARPVQWRSDGISLGTPEYASVPTYRYLLRHIPMPRGTQAASTIRKHLRYSLVRIRKTELLYRISIVRPCFTVRTLVQYKFYYKGSGLALFCRIMSPRLYCLAVSQ